MGNKEEKKKEILAMSEEELIKEKWKKRSDCSYCCDCSDCSDCSYCCDCSNCSDCSDCSDCSYCCDCSNCSDCSDCSDCSYCCDCSNCEKEKSQKYMIANVQFTKEEYEKWKKKH